MDGDGRIGEESGKKPTHTTFVHHRAHMARARIESGTPRTRGEHSITERPRLQNSSHTLWNIIIGCSEIDSTVLRAENST